MCIRDLGHYEGRASSGNRALPVVSIAFAALFAICVCATPGKAFRVAETSVRVAGAHARGSTSPRHAAHRKVSVTLPSGSTVWDVHVFVKDHDAPQWYGPCPAREGGSVDCAGLVKSIEFSDGYKVQNSRGGVVVSWEAINSGPRDRDVRMVVYYSPEGEFYDVPVGYIPRVRARPPE